MADYSLPRIKENELPEATNVDKVRVLDSTGKSVWVEKEDLPITEEQVTGLTDDLALKADKSDLNGKVNTTDIEQVRSQATNKVASSKLLDDELTAVNDSLVQLAGDVKDTTEKPTAQSLSELNARITALEAIISNKIKDRVDVTKEFNVWGKTNLILYGTGANAKAPDFIGQKYIDTAGGNVYVAVGTDNAGNWKLV